MPSTIDLLAPEAPARVEAEVCIIGGGTAGALLARRLVDAGVAAVVLEAGSDSSADAGALGFEPHLEGAPYGGALAGRAFGLGGSSSRWGGVLVPHGELDAAATRGNGEPWSTIIRIAGEHLGRVRKLLGVRTPPDYEDRSRRSLGTVAGQLEQVGIRTSSAEMLPFRSRNLRRLLQVPARDPNLTTVLNAVVSEWMLEPTANGAQVRRVRAVSRAGRTLDVAARQFVIAAGALESARILLEVDEASQGQALAGRLSIGRGLSDHLSTTVAEVEAKHWPRVVRHFAPRFDGPLMKTIRMADLDSIRAGVRHFAHFLFPVENPGFQLAKKVLFARQAGEFPRVSLREVIEGSRGIAALGFDRFLRSRLYVPKDTPARLQLDVEQESIPENALLLGQERDRYGRRRATIRWSMTERDRQRIRSCATSFLAKWSRAGDGLPGLAARPPEDAQQKPHDAYHPVGLTRMGTDAGAVVDLRLSVRGTSNLSLVSTGVLPSAGTANPTLSMLCLADDLADRLIDVCGRDSARH